MIMKAISKSIGLVVVGMVIGSLPLTLSMGRINAQDLGRLKPKRIPANIDNIVVDDGMLYITSGSNIYKISRNNLTEREWWSMPPLPLK